MMRLYYANRLESLVAPLAQAVAEQQAERPLETVVIVVPDAFVPGPFGDSLESYRALEHFVRFRLAERLGVAANLDFPTLRGYLSRTLEGLNPSLRVLGCQDLQLAVFECLRTPAFRDDPELLVLSNADAAAAADDREIEKRTFELAAKVGTLFHEYAATRRAMLRKWRAGSLVTTEPYRRLERWQRRLYLSLFDSDGALRPQWAAEQSHRCMLLPDALDALEPSTLKPGLPLMLHFFGCSDADPILTRALTVLNASGDLRVYALNPCREFWENVAAGRAADLELRAAAVQADPEADDGGVNDLEKLGLDCAGAERDSPALRFWARPGRELTRLLNELSGYDFDSHFILAADDGRQSLLGSLQDSILNGEPERPPVPDGEPAQPCASICFVACPGARREVEAVATAVWSFLQESDAATAPGSPPLRFHEIAVLFPDSQREVYLPHIEALFEQRYQIPLNVVNRSLISESRVAEVLGLLLDLPLSRFTREEVIRVLTHPAITGPNAEANAQRWRRWCEELGIVFGADARDFAGTYIPKDVYHWDQALRRLSLGAFMVGERGGSTELFHAEDGCAYLPFEVEQDEGESVAKLVRSARGLLGSALELKSAQLVLADWSDTLIRLVKSYVQAADAADERVLDCCLRALESIAPHGVASGPVGYDIARRLVARRAAEIEAARGQLSYTGLVVGPLSALRALPFRAIFFLGLGGAAFPDRERLDWRDLRLDKREREDSTLTERQRYWFLQTLLAARDRLFLSYGSLDPHTGDPLEPSIVVHELQSILRGYVSQSALEQMTIPHPLNRYDLECFPNLQSPAEQQPDQAPVSASEIPAQRYEVASFDSEARQAARLSALREDLERHYGRIAPPEGTAVLGLLAQEQRDKLRGTLRLPEAWRAERSTSNPPSEVSLPLAALRRFLECPIQGTAMYAFGMSEDDPVEVEENEPLSQPRPQRVRLLRRAFWQGRGDPDAVRKAYLDGFRLEQVKGQAPFGPFAQVRQQADLAMLQEWLRLTREADLGDLAKWQDLQIGPADEFAEAANRSLPAIHLNVPRRAADGSALRRSDGSPVSVAVSLHGRLSRLSATLGCALHLVARDRATPRDFLGPFIWALALRAAGVLDGDCFETVVIAVSEHGQGQASKKTLALPTPQAALAYLTDSADDLLSGRAEYFLPIEAVAAVLSHLRPADAKHQGSLRDIIRRLREDERLPVSSASGPVRNARRFPPPKSDDEVQEIIERRFGPFRQIFI